MDTHILNNDYTAENMMTLRQHTITTEDALLQLGQISRSETFYQIGSLYKRNKVLGVKPGEIYNSDTFLQAETISHYRRIYGFLDLLGDLGGVTEVLAVCFGFMLYPLAEFFFILDATKQIFMVKTKNDNLLLKTKKPEYQLDRIQRHMKDEFTLEELKTHRYIKIRFTDKLLLYMKKILGFGFVSRFWKQGSQFEKIYEKGQQRID